MTSPQTITLSVNGGTHTLTIDPDTPLLYVLRDHLQLKGPKYGCGDEQCGACKVLVDGAAVPSCRLPVSQVQQLPVTTVEGLGQPGNLHPLQEAFLHEQAAQCGYCTAGMIIAAQGLLNHTRYPTDEQIAAALSDNICRCGVYHRVRRAIHLRVGNLQDPIYQTESTPPLAQTAVQTEEALPRSLQNYPQLDDWLRFNKEDQTITVFTGKVELGQGILTALAQIVAEELDVRSERLRLQSGDTARTPDEGGTTGSMSLQTSGNALRWAAAAARRLLLARALEELEAASLDDLEVVDGAIRDRATGRQTDYWRLLAGQRLGHTLAAGAPIAPPKKAAAHTLVGAARPRIDLLKKVTGQPAFVHDLQLEGMVYGRIVPPPAYDATLVHVDTDAVQQMPGVLAVVRDGSFLGVIADHEARAIAARDALAFAATWRNETQLATDPFHHLRHSPSSAHPVIDGVAHEQAPAPQDAVETDLKATYYRPYHMHGALGPSAAAALLQDGQLTIWCHSQAVFVLRDAIAQVLQMDPANIHVMHVEGAGCYGHNGADDAALDAALLARAVPGRPVLLQWTREDEHAWEPYGPAMIMALGARLDDKGRIAAWQHDIWSYPHVGRPRAFTDGSSSFVSAWRRAHRLQRPSSRQLFGAHFGSYRNADPLYTYPRTITDHFVPHSPLRTSSQRGLGAYANVFAIESFMDELAHAAGQDPLAFRLAHLDDERARAVLQAVATAAGWQPRTRPAAKGHGRGLAFARYKNRACYAAVVVDLQVDITSGEIHLQQATIAADAGEIVNPDGLSNQLEGGLVQAASWTLYEQVQSDAGGITSRDWESYPVLRFPNAPRIHTVLLNRPGMPFLGSGEATQGPTPAAIANAIFDATGLRLRRIPFTPDRVRRQGNA